MQLVQKTVLSFLKKLKIKIKKIKIELQYDPAIPNLGIYPKEMKSFSKRYLHSHVHATLFTTVKTQKEPQCP